MTRAQQALAGHWRSIAVLCWLMALSGASVIGWSLYGQLADEADLRGQAVSTLAGDVRVLRAQVQASGETPRAPDPSQAIDGLQDRARVPVPVVGPRGPQGEPGLPGEPGPSGSPGASGSPGRDGKDGTAGTDGTAGQDGVGQDGATGPAGPPGPQGDPGPAGPPGERGPAGEDGQDGQTCPSGFTLQAPAYDPDALVCRREQQPSDSDSQPASPMAAGLEPGRRRYL